MNDVTNPASGTDDSTVSATSTVNDIIKSNLDARIDEAFATVVPETPKQEEPAATEETAEVVENEVPVDEDPGLETADDDSNIKDEESDESENVIDQGHTPAFDIVATLDDLRENRQGIEIDGKVRDADAIHSAFKRQSSLQKKLDEVETRETAVKEEWQKIETAGKSLEATTVADKGTKMLAQLEVKWNDLNKKLALARQKNDTNAMTLLNHDMNSLNTDYQKIESAVEQATQDKIAYARHELANYGMSELMSDAQRNQSFNDYMSKHIPANVFDLVQQHAALMVMGEKARMFDQQSSKLPRGKLKVNPKRTLKGNSGKGGFVPKKPPVDPIQSKIDEMFKT